MAQLLSTEATVPECLSRCPGEGEGDLDHALVSHAGDREARIEELDAGLPVLLGHSVLARMRAQLNFVENTAFVLVLVAGIELAGRGNPWLAWVVAIYMLGRVAHGFGMDGGTLGKGRSIGTIVTMLTQLGLAAVAVLIVLGVM